MRNNLKKARRQPDVRKIKKHSDIVKQYGNNLVVTGTRDKSAHGYIATGFSGKTFRTSYEVMLAGTSTDLLTHEKKDKVIRVMSGQGFVILQQQDDQGQWQSVEKRIIPGDEISFERGVRYRITTTSNEDLSMFVVESASYDKQLKVVEKCGVSKEVADEMLKSPTEFQQLQANRPDLLDRPRTKSKAAEQLKAKRSQRASSAQIQQVGRSNAPESVNKVFSKNPRPTGGVFDDAGAG